jgi:hypothetical protein
MTRSCGASLSETSAECVLKARFWTTLSDMRPTVLLFVAFAGLAALAGCAGSTEDTSGAAQAASSNDEVKSAKVLLDCNVFLSGGGPDQEVRVEQRGTALVLRELTNHGSWEERPLSKEEWSKKDLKLRNDDLDGPEAVNRLYLEAGDWMNESKSDGWHAMGMADCADPNR